MPSQSPGPPPAPSTETDRPQAAEDSLSHTEHGRSSGRAWLSLQSLTNLAVVVGIVVLIYELKLTRELARVQAVDEAYTLSIQRNLSLMGEAPAEVLARSIFTPERISPADVVVLNQYFVSLVTQWTRMKDERAVGYFGRGWKAVVQLEAPVLNTPVGRRWWEGYRQYTDLELMHVVDEVLAEIPVSASREYFERLLPPPSEIPDAQAGSP